MKQKIVHYGSYKFPGMAYKTSYCGKSVLDSTPSTIDLNEVTCKNCQKKLEKHNTKGLRVFP
jgi:DNA-directed RNA polymerase subunit RPC12/RpoP